MLCSLTEIDYYSVTVRPSGYIVELHATIFVSCFVRQTARLVGLNTVRGTRMIAAYRTLRAN